jgi:SAM-dependent methyltransferase
LLRAFVRKILRKTGWENHRVAPPAASRLDRISEYKQNGRVPWSTGYQETRDLFVEQALDNEALLESFRRGEALPPGYGIGIDERVVEYPWTYARLPRGGGRVLDAGSTLNYAFLVAHPLIRAKKLHILTLVPERRCHCVIGVSHIYDELRSIPISTGYYDIVTCISTLEHIGMDNTLFRGGKEDAPDDYLIAVREMWRVLRPGGVLLLTVPFGPYKNFGSFQLFDKRLIDNVIGAFAPSNVEESYFRYTAQGWSLSDALACADAEYVPWIMQSAKERPMQCPVQPDNAAAARAVACLKMAK